MFYFLALSISYLTFENFNLIGILNNMKKILFKMVFGNM